MEANPYAPPQAKVADPQPESHGLKRRSVLVMLLFTLITFGLYHLVWWFRRRPGLNRLNSPKKLAAWPLLLYAAMFTIQFCLGLAAGIMAPEEVIGEGGRLLLGVLQIAVAIVMIIQAFRIKDMIEDHAEPEAESGPMFVDHVRLSGLMTFFFSIYYLQWAINRYVAGTQS
jgi:hypothetical protein